MHGGLAFGFVVGILYLAFWCLVGCTMLAVLRWANRGRRNAEAYYKTALLGKITDQAGAAAAIELLREEERIASARRREKYKAAAFVNMMVGLALMLFLLSLPSARHAFLVGLIPFMIGVALLAVAVF